MIAVLSTRAALLSDAQPVHDGFNRADSASVLGTADSGQPWVAHVGTWGVTGNGAYCSNHGAGAARASIDAAMGNAYGQADMSGVGVIAPFGIIARVSNDGANFLIFYSDGNLYAPSGVVASSSGVTPPAIMAVRASDLLIECFVNGIRVIAHTLTGSNALACPPSNTRWGLYANGGEGLRCNDFLVRRRM